MMNVLLRTELYKLWRTRWLLPVMLGLGAVFVFMTLIHYRWNESGAWEGITGFPYTLGSIIEAVIVLVALSACYCSEYETGTDALLLSSVNGRRNLAMAKTSAALLFTTGVVIGYWCMNIALHLSLAGAEGWNEPLSALDKYVQTPYAITVWQYVLIQIGINWLGTVMLGMIVLWLSSRSKQALTVYFIGGIVWITPYWIRYFSEFSLSWALKNMLPAEWMRVEALFASRRYVSIGDTKLDLPLYAFLLYSTVVIVISIYGTGRSYSNREAC